MADDEEPVNKRMKKSPVENTPLDGLPTEILLKIFGSFEMLDLLRCGQVSKRIRSIANYKTLWEKVNLKYRYKVSVALIRLILENGCKHLIIGDLHVEGDLMPVQNFRLKHLVVGRIKPVKTLEVILASCNSLEKLSLRYVSISNKMILGINQNGKTLKKLNLEECYEPIDSKNLTEFIQSLIDNCIVLEELNLKSFHCTEVSIDYLVNHLTRNILKLSLFSAKIEDHQLKTLVTRCNKLKELNLRCTNISNLNPILTHLHSTLEKLGLGSNWIDLAKLSELKSMKRLKILDLSGCYEGNIDVVKKDLPNIKIVQRDWYFIAEGYRQPYFLQ